MLDKMCHKSRAFWKEQEIFNAWDREGVENWWGVVLRRCVCLKLSMPGL
jgi:hypothetical protein